MALLVGQTRTLEASFTAGGAPADPTTVILTITAPDGTITTPAPTHDGVGEYHYDLLLDQAGTWTEEWEGTGAVPATISRSLVVLDPAHQGPSEGPCDDWNTWDELADYCTPADIGPLLQDAVLAQATRVLWNRSCQQFGLCTIVRARVTPRCQHGYTWRAGMGFYPSGGWNTGRGSSCACGSYRYIDLGVEPVVRIDEVLIDGTTLDPDAYRVDDWRRLVRTDDNPWPPSTLQPDSGEPGTLEVSWTYGAVVPADAKMMHALLACKMSHDVIDACGAEPANMTQKIAEGVTITINPPDGDTGIALVERWLSNFHCGGGGIFDPGAHKATMRVGT